jgi:hypothetical protein
MIPDNPDRNSCDRARAIAIQTDGKVLVAGSSDAPNGDSNFALVRYNPDGSMDNTFEDNSIFPGTVLTNFRQLPDGDLSRDWLTPSLSKLMARSWSQENLTL